MKNTPNLSDDADVAQGVPKSARGKHRTKLAAALALGLLSVTAAANAQNVRGMSAAEREMMGSKMTDTECLLSGKSNCVSDENDADQVRMREITLELGAWNKFDQARNRQEAWSAISLLLITRFEQPEKHNQNKPGTRGLIYQEIGGKKIPAFSYSITPADIEITCQHGLCAGEVKIMSRQFLKNFKYPN